LISSVQKDVLPSYGFEANSAGASQMAVAFGSFSSSREISANLEKINQLLSRGIEVDRDSPAIQDESVAAADIAIEPPIKGGHLLKASDRLQGRWKHPQWRNSCTIGRRYIFEGIPTATKRRGDREGNDIWEAAKSDVLREAQR